MILSTHGIIPAGRYSMTDADAIAFISVIGDTNDTVNRAVDELFIYLKANSLQSKLRCMHLFVGGTATAHKYNALNPVDSDAAFRLTFTGGWTHSASGARPDGTSGYADTHFNGYTVFGASPTDTHFSYYAQLQCAGLSNGVSVGAYVDASNNLEIIDSAGGGSNYYVDFPNGSRVSAVHTTTTGLRIVVNTSADGKDLYVNGSKLIDTAYISSEVWTNSNVVLGQWGNGTRWSNTRYAGFTIGDGLTPTDCANLTTAFNTFNTTLGR